MFRIIEDLIEQYGIEAGFSINTFIIFYDLLATGWRHFFEWRISYWGIIGLIIGTILMGYGKILRKLFR